MKVLFTEDIIEVILNDGEECAQARKLLDLVQDHVIEGYLCDFVYFNLLKKYNQETMYRVFCILRGLLKPIRPSFRDLHKALEEKDMEFSLYETIACRHHMDLIVSAKLNEESKIKMYDPKELLRRLDHGKTA